MRRGPKLPAARLATVDNWKTQTWSGRGSPWRRWIEEQSTSYTFTTSHTKQYNQGPNEQSRRTHNTTHQAIQRVLSRVPMSSQDDFTTQHTKQYNVSYPGSQCAVNTKCPIQGLNEQSRQSVLSRGPISSQGYMSYLRPSRQYSVPNPRPQRPVKTTTLKGISRVGPT